MPSATIVELPVTRWREYKQLRLEALKKEPLAYGASHEEARKNPDKKWRDDLRKSLIGTNNKILFAEDKGKLVGMMRMYFAEWEKSRHVAHLGGVYVKNSHRGQKIAKSLLQLLVQWAKERKALKVQLQVNPVQSTALALYRASGFIVVGTLRKDMKVGNNFYDENIMELYIEK